MDIKCVVSRDNGRTWSKEAMPIDASTHRGYMPGALELTGVDDNPLLVLFLDTHAGFRGKRGAMTTPAAQ